MSQQHWKDDEIYQLLFMRGAEDIQRQISGTVRDTAIYKDFSRRLKAQGFDRAPRQVINKLKSLKRTYLSMRENNRDRRDWPFYDLCDKIFGSSAQVNIKISVPPSPTLSSTSTTLSNTGSKDDDTVISTTVKEEDIALPTTVVKEEDTGFPTTVKEEDTGFPTTVKEEDREVAGEEETTRPRTEDQDGEHTEKPETSTKQQSGTNHPMRRKRTRLDQAASILSTVVAELKDMDRAAAEREDARFNLFLEQDRKLLESLERQHKEAREDQRRLFEMLLSRPFYNHEN